MLPTERHYEEPEEPRNFLQEAIWILQGRTLRMAQYEHLAALDAHYRALLEKVQPTVEPVEEFMPISEAHR